MKGGCEINIANEINDTPALETVQMFTAVKAKQHIILNHKFINESSHWVYGEVCKMSVGKRNKSTDAVIEYALTYQGALQDYRFNNYDKRVYNAVCSLYEAGNSILTPPMVYRQMNGLRGNEKVSDRSIVEIIESIEKSMQTFAGIDFTDEARNYNKRHEDYMIKGNLLDADKVHVFTGIRNVIGFQLNDKPLLYKYFQMNTEQIISVDTEVLNVKDTIKRESRSVTLIREYLLQRIAIMKKNGKKTSNRILFDRLYEELEILNPSKKDIEMTRVNAEKILWSLVDKKYIKKYDLYKKGRAFVGMEIIY